MTGTARQHQRPKRVARACDYCRRKRLKCTSNQRPCLNFQLYHAECTSWDERRRPRVGSSSRLRGSEPSTVAQVAQSPPAIIEEQPAVNLTFDPGSGSQCGLNVDLPLAPSCWMPQPQFDTGSSPQDFGHLLHQLGINFPATFEERESSVLPSLPDLDGASTQTATGREGSHVLGASTGGSPAVEPRVPSSFASTPRSTTTSSHGRVSSIASLTRKDDVPNEESRRSVPPGVFIRKDESVANYIGPNSVGATLALCVKDALEYQGLPVDASSMGFLIEAGPHVDEVGLLSAFDVSSQYLPPREAAVRSINAYFGDLNVFYPIVEEESFRSRTEVLYSSQPTGYGVLEYSMFLLVVSIGQLSLNHQSKPTAADDEKLATDTYERAWSMIHDAMATPREASLQVLLLHVMRNMYYGRSGIAWIFSGLAVRVAESLGLHRQGPTEIGLSDRQLRLRARLWWTTLRFDIGLSLSQGRPPGATHTICERETIVDSACLAEPSSFPTLPQIYTWACEVLLLQNRFCSIMHSVDTLSSRAEAITRVDEDLVAWRDSIPVQCRPDNLILVSPSRYIHILLLHLEYHNLVRALHWAVITQRAACEGGPGSGGLPSRFKASERLCVEAARSFITILNESESILKSEKAFVMSFQTENYMAAMAVLYRSITKGPYYFSARADLEHMRACRLHLQRDTPDNVNGPLLQGLFDKMVLSAESLVWNKSPGV